MLNSQHGAVIDDPGSHEQLPEVLHLKAIIASHHGITIQSNDQLQVFRIIHLLPQTNHGSISDSVHLDLVVLLVFVR